MRSIVIAAVLFVSAGALAKEDPSRIDWQRGPVKGWPQLTVQGPTYVPVDDLLKTYCKNVVSGYRTLACAVIDLERGTCGIYLDDRFVTMRSERTGVNLERFDKILADSIEHERAHCGGYDHPGGEYMQRLFDRWKYGR